jgi:hypothetical protein
MGLEAQSDLHVSMKLKRLRLLRSNFTISTLHRAIGKKPIENEKWMVAFGSEHFKEKHERV